MHYLSVVQTWDTTEPNAPSPSVVQLDVLQICRNSLPPPCLRRRALPPPPPLSTSCARRCSDCAVGLLAMALGCWRGLLLQGRFGGESPASRLTPRTHSRRGALDEAHKLQLHSRTALPHPDIASSPQGPRKRCILACSRDLGCQCCPCKLQLATSVQPQTPHRLPGDQTGGERANPLL